MNGTMNGSIKKESRMNRVLEYWEVGEKGLFNFLTSRERDLTKWRNLKAR